MKDKLKAFINDLNELTNKYGIEIASCGCCSSPYLLATDAEFLVIANNLKFDKKTKMYCIENKVTGSYQYKSNIYHQIDSKLVEQKEFDGFVVGENFNFWNNEEDDIYDNLSEFLDSMSIEAQTKGITEEETLKELEQVREEMWNERKK